MAHISLFWMQNEKNKQKRTFIFQTMTFTSGWEASANMTTDEWTRLRASNNLNSTSASFSGLVWWTPQPNEARKPGRSFSRANILDAEIMNHSKTGSRSVKNLERIRESSAASTEASKRREQKVLKDCQGTDAKGARRKATIALGEKCKACWERAHPKGPRAGSCPCLKEKVVYSIQKGWCVITSSSLPSLTPPLPQVQFGTTRIKWSSCWP